MTRGRKGNKTYTGYNGASEDSLRAMDKLAHTPAGQFGRVAAPSQAVTREFIKSQTCPWCGEGPYKILAGHTWRAHGVSGEELREMAGLTKCASICDQQVSEEKASRLKGVRLPKSAYAKQRKPRSLSEAGKQVCRAKLDEARGRHPDRGAAQAKSASQARVAKVAAENAPKYRAAEVLAAEGSLTLAEISSRVGLHPRTLGRHLKQAGVVPRELRTLRQRSPHQRAEFRARMRAATAVRQEDLRRERLAYFASCGGSWDAVHACARHWGVTTKTAAAYLKKSGAHVPDGRGGAA